mmetsp:Transcript_8331/g.24952  ORF Transcript_8331/g.24952 Transcript_8331/m.24952 type:complete len:90 (+) Transcript_8331:4841-5110(+)
MRTAHSLKHLTACAMYPGAANKHAHQRLAGSVASCNVLSILSASTASHACIQTPQPNSSYGILQWFWLCSAAQACRLSQSALKSGAARK